MATFVVPLCRCGRPGGDVTLTVIVMGCMFSTGS